MFVLFCCALALFCICTLSGLVAYYFRQKKKKRRGFTVYSTPSDGHIAWKETDDNQALHIPDMLQSMRHVGSIGSTAGKASQRTTKPPCPGKDAPALPGMPDYSPGASPDPTPKASPKPSPKASPRGSPRAPLRNSRGQAMGPQSSLRSSRGKDPTEAIGPPLPSGSPRTSLQGGLRTGMAASPRPSQGSRQSSASPRPPQRPSQGSRRSPADDSDGDTPRAQFDILRPGEEAGPKPPSVSRAPDQPRLTSQATDHFTKLTSLRSSQHEEKPRDLALEALEEMERANTIAREDARAEIARREEQKAATLARPKKKKPPSKSPNASPRGGNRTFVRR